MMDWEGLKVRARSGEEAGKIFADQDLFSQITKAAILENDQGAAAVLINVASQVEGARKLPPELLDSFVARLSAAVTDLRLLFLFAMANPIEPSDRLLDLLASAVTGHGAEVARILGQIKFPQSERAQAIVLQIITSEGALGIKAGAVNALHGHPHIQSELNEPLLGLLEEFLRTDHESGLNMPFFVALRSAVLASPALRKRMRRLVFPARRTENEVKPEEGDDLRGCWVRLVKRHHDPIATSAMFDWAMALLQENCLRLVYHVGYGNAAGYLFHRNMLNQLQSDIASFPLEARFAEDLSSDEEEMKLRRDAGINPVTGAEDSISSDQPMTEEEKEAEAARLIDLFQRLDQTGVMKVLKPQ